MGKYKICVYAICKNEEKFIDRWIDSMKEADLIVVADTGSTDNSIKKLKKRGAKVHSIKVDPWRFDTARNMSMDFIPKDVDICICTDIDEIFETGWRELLEKSWTPKTTRLKYSYTWNFNEDGTPGITFLYEKIHKRYGFKWIHPVHEILEYSGSEPDNYAYCYDIKLLHKADPTKSRSNYLPLLEMSVKEDPTDDRNIHYLGREYMFYGKWDECIKTLELHLKLPKATWNDERCASMRYIARAYKEKTDLYSSKIWLFRAIAEAPYLREPYVEMARLAYISSDWSLVYAMVESSLRITEKPTSYINEAFCWDYTIYDLGSLACYNLGLFETALNYSKKACEMSPNDERLKENYKIIKDKYDEFK
jgi:glycosyltransferase involved in cell wall biosynthesis